MVIDAIEVIAIALCRSVVNLRVEVLVSARVGTNSCSITCSVFKFYTRVSSVPNYGRECEYM